MPAVLDVAVVSLIALAGAAPAGCGSSDTRSFSCDATTAVGGTMIHACTDDEGVPASSIDGLTSSCKGASATVVHACAAQGRLGSCALPTDGSSPFAATIHYYAGGGLTATTAELQCAADGGTWTDGG